MMPPRSYLDLLYAPPFRAPTRDATESERQFFQKNPTVAGYAAPDGSVVLNPWRSWKPGERQSVVANEQARLLMRSGRVPQPSFRLTPQQTQSFSGYGPPLAQRQTVAARTLAGDPSVGRTTPQQQSYADRLRGETEPESMLMQFLRAFATPRR